MKIFKTFVKVLLSMVFLFTGLTKLFLTDFQAVNFVHWGYPFWFMIVVGIIEVAAVALLWIQKTESLAVAVLTVVMIGALSTHIRSGDPVEQMGLAFVAVALILLLVIAKIRAKTL